MFTRVAQRAPERVRRQEEKSAHLRATMVQVLRVDEVKEMWCEKYFVVCV